ncbi:glycosyltransferase, partial [bacterium]|nr:glycosyltransferase [bacterium]
LAAAALSHRSPDTFQAGLRFIIGENLTSTLQQINDLTESTKFHCLVHPASADLFPEYYITLSGQLRTRQAAKRGGYKILLVSPIYGGTLPMTTYIQNAFNNLGHRCEILDNSVFRGGLDLINGLTSSKQHAASLNAGLTTLLAEMVTARALDLRADLVLWIAQSPATPEVLQELKKADIQTAFWFVEDYQLLPYWQSIALHFDHFFIIQKGEFEQKLMEIGCRQPHYLPVAADPHVHLPLNLSPEELSEFGSDLSHVGAGYFNRRDFFTGLLDYDFKLWGSDWEKSGVLNRILQRAGARISTEDTVKIFNATKINVNLHSSTFHSGVNPFGDFLNPRTFELAACGAFQLVDQRKYLADNYDIGSEVDTFSSLQEFRDKAAHYLENPQERIEMAEAARARTLKEHTYEHRMSELLGVIAGRCPQWEPKSGGLPTAEDLITEAGVESELAQVMQQFVGRGPLTLEDIAADLEKGEGQLKRTEAMILLLNEFRRWGVEKGVV